MITKQELYIICRIVRKTTTCFITGIPNQQGELKTPTFKEQMGTVCAALWAADFVPS